MTNANNDVRELEALLTELEGQGALPVGPYSDEDDAVTQLMDAPLGEQEWMVQITPHDRRMMSTEQLLSELQTGVLVQRDMLVWRAGMGDWAPIASIDELRSALPVEAPAPRPLPPPPAPLPPRLGSSVNASPGPLSLGSVSSPRAPMPAPASVPFAMPKPAADVPPPPPVMPLSSSPYASPPAPTPELPSGLPALNSAFNGAPSDLGSTAISPGAAPPPAVARVNTARPVAVDFSEMEPRRSAPMRIIIGSGIAALAMIVGTVYGLSAGGVFESSTELSAEHSAPASASSKPASAAAAVAAKPSTPAPAPAAKAEAPKAEAPKADEPMTQTVSAKESEPVAVTPAVAAEPEAKDEPKPSKAKGSDEEERAEASSSDSSERAEVSSTRSEGKKGRRMKRGSASSEEKEEKKARAKAEPRRSKPRAAVAAAEEPRPEEEQPKEAAGSTFNKQAATAALDDAASKAKNCRPQGGPSGTGKVQVRYEPNGKVGAVSILTPSFANTTTGDCVVMVFRRANVPAFTGAPAVVLNKNFDIPAN